jgi:hypothetical protein
MYSQRQEDLDLFSSHLEAKKAGPLVCPICSQTNTILPKGAPIGEPSERTSIRLRCMHKLRILNFLRH